MPKVLGKRENANGAERSCGRPGCGQSARYRAIPIAVAVLVAGYGLYQIDEPWLTFAAGVVGFILALGGFGVDIEWMS